MRARAGHSDRPDAADCRGALRRRRSREAGHVRYVDLPGPGNDVWQPVASGELQPREPRAGLRDRARSADRSGRDAARRAARRNRRRSGRRRRQERSEQVGDLRRAGGRQGIQPAGECERKTQRAARMDRPRQADAACRSARDGHRAIGIRPQRARARNGPRRGREAARGRCGARGRGRSVRTEPPGFHQGGHRRQRRAAPAPTRRTFRRA